MNKLKRHYLEGLYSYISMIGNLAIKNRSDVIIWGYSKGGAFVRYLLENYDQRVHVTHIIDQNMLIPANCEPRIYRQSVLEYIEGNKYILLSTIRDFPYVRNYASRFGFVEGENLFDVRSYIGVSYIDFLQISNKKLDFRYVTSKERPDVYSDPNVSISTPVEGVCVDRLFDEISNLEENISFFDYGCGKGQTLLYSYMWGGTIIRGIELVPEIADIARMNMRELGINADIVCGDATTYSDIDNINVFFLNNPFLGEIFEKVMLKIEESCMRKSRRTHIVYLNPRCNNVILKNGIFKLKRQLYVDMGDPLANFYCNE